MSKYRIVEFRGSKGQLLYYQAQKRVFFWWETLTDFEYDEFSGDVHEYPFCAVTLEQILETIQEDKDYNKKQIITKTYIEVE